MLAVYKHVRECNAPVDFEIAPRRQLAPDRTVLVHTEVMGVARKAVRQSVSLPADVAAEVRRMAKGRRLSANRVMLELIENGIVAEKRKEQQFFELAERFRSATEPADIKRLGDELGRMIFGD
jgi:hypothetical protein